MSRRPDLRRLLEPRRAALRAQSDRSMSAWDKQVRAPETPTEFDAAYEWIVIELASGPRR